MKKILTITMNPALDVSAGVDRIEPVRKLRCGTARRDPGGGGINVARVVRRLGGDVSPLFPAGGYIGELFADLVAREGLDCLKVPISGQTRENFTATETDTGDQYRFVFSGPEMTAAERQACLEALARELPSAGLVVASGSLPPGMPDDFYALVSEMAAKYGVSFILDASGPALAGALAACPDLIKPNLRELNDLMGAELAAEDEQVGACRRLVADGKVGAVALTLGVDGGLLVTGQGVWRGRTPDVQVNSAVGAGDSFTAGMAWAMASGWSLEKAFALGIAAGTAAVLTPGTELCHADDVRRLADQVVLEPLPSGA